jgi:hypothetical protein
MIASDESKALQIIHDENLAHTESLLVQSFLLDARNRDEAARYLLQIRADDTRVVKLAQFVQDWKCLVKLCEIRACILSR